MNWVIMSPINNGLGPTNVKIGASVVITIVTIVFNLACFASLSFMHFKNVFNYDKYTLVRSEF